MNAPLGAAGPTLLKKIFPMVSLRYFSPLVLALSLLSRSGQAQRADLTPLQPLPRLPAAPDQVVRRPVAPVLTSPPASAPVVARQQGPLYLLNSRLLIGTDGLGKINPQDIDKLVVYKGTSNSATATPTQWRGLDANGIVAITLKKHVKRRLKSQSLAQLGRHLQAQGPVSYTINGLPAASGALRIATASITEINLVPTLSGTTVGVWLGGGPSQPTPTPTKTYPPGTIMIRGTARR